MFISIKIGQFLRTSALPLLFTRHALLQMQVARMLGVGAHKITSRVKRLGGGFGGKETRAVPYALATAFVASQLRRPVRFMLDRDHDMISSGTRHPVLGKYKVAFSKDGNIQGGTS